MTSNWIQQQIEKLLDEAGAAISQLDWETTRQRALAILGLDEANVDALALLEAVERNLENPATPSPTPAAQVVQQPNAPIEDKPTSFADGRYQVQRFLGEGGKKMVYLAQDSLLDRDVAFALIKTDGLDDVSRTRISREAQAMGRLGSHPHIVTVFDLGEHESQPFMVTELMGGGDVEGVLEDVEGGKLSLEQAISIAIETCRGLEFAHSRGIIHRDLKPGNVWLTADGVAKIGDFGLAVAMDRSRLTAEGMMVGTVSYMPPEQAMGGEVTPKADLYALGAMLYEMVCGRPPFLGDDNIAIIGQHINTPPVAPTWHRSDCPRPLEALIMRLLSKDPSERPENASDVLAALEAVDVSKSDAGMDSEPAREANVLDSLTGEVFVGRQREMDDLKAALEDALSGRGRMVTLVGEPGIGKTRTSQELATYAGLRGCQVLWGRCYEEQGVPPYWPWVQAIRNYVRERDPEELSSEMGSGAADIAEIVSDVRDRLPDLPKPPQIDDPESARFRLFDSITAFLKTASQRQPLVLVLDDLHWSDQPSLALMQFIVRELAGARLLLIGTYRDMELNRRHPLAEALGDLTRERLFHRVLLRGLSHDDVGRFIEVTSGIRPPVSLVDAVHTQTEGNPLFVTEVVRLLVQEGELSPDASTVDRESWTVRIPEGVREVIGRRLNQLSARCNDVLTVASVVGREFEFRQMDRLVDDLTEDMLLDVLEEGLDARVIAEMPTAVGRYQFTHALIQETLAEELSLTRRVRLHARIAKTLEGIYGDNAANYAAELAHHFAQAEAMLGNEKLVEYSNLAGERALSNYAYEDAQSHFQSALASKEGQPIDDQTAAIYEGLGQAQAGTLPRGELPTAVDSLRIAFDYYVKSGQSARAAQVALFPFPRVHGLTGLADLFMQASKLAPLDSSESGYWLAQFGLFASFETGEYEPCEIAFARALEIAHLNKDTGLEMQILMRSGLVDVTHLKPQADQKLKRAFEFSKQSTNLQVQAAVAEGIALYSRRIGNPDDAQNYLLEGLEAARKLRNRIVLLFAYSNLASYATSVGEWESAVKYSDQALALDPHEMRAVMPRILCDYNLGEFERAAPNVWEVMEFKEQNIYPFARLALAFCARVSDDRELIESLNTRLEQAVTEQGLEPRTHMMTQAGLGLIAVYKLDRQAAKTQYTALTQYPSVDFMVLAGISNQRLLGLLSHTIGNLDVSQGHFEDALTFCREVGYRPELAWSLHDYADMLLERDSPGDQQKATKMLDEALQISTDLSMRPLMERALSKRDILKA